MNGIIADVNTDANGLKEAKELSDYEQALRLQYLTRRHGKQGGQDAFEAEKRAKR